MASSHVVFLIGAAGQGFDYLFVQEGKAPVQTSFG